MISSQRQMALSLLLFTAMRMDAADTPPADAKPAPSKAADRKTPAPALDRSKKTRKGKASYYGHKFYGKRMAGGEAMDPRSNAAASKTLPIGTKAKVTNLETGKSDVVVIKDRGPYIKGRIIDVSPKTAEKLDLKEDGVATVKVTPLEVPKNPGDAGREADKADSAPDKNKDKTDKEDKFDQPRK